MKRFPWFETILIVVVMSISLYAALSDPQNLSLRWFTRDDAYYYFKVAQNISEGRGSTFDGINPTNGYHPLWMLICIPIFVLARFDLILPLRILLLVMSGLSVATAILLYRLVGRIFTPAIGAIVALFWVFSRDIVDTLYRNGLESGIAALFIVLLAYKLYEFEVSWRKEMVSRKQIVVLALIAVLALFSRLDLIFLVGVVGLWIVLRGSLLRVLLPLDIALIVVITLLAFILRVDTTGYYGSVEVGILMVASSLIVKLAFAFLFGLYQRAVLSRPIVLLQRLVLFALASSVIIAALMLASLRFGWVQGSFSRLTILIDLGLTLLFFGGSRLMLLGLRTDRAMPPGQPDKPWDEVRQHWQRWFRESLLYYGITFGMLGLYMVWSRFVFGTSSPVSGQIKQWWATLPGRAYGGSPRDPLDFFGLGYLEDDYVWKPVSGIVGAWADGLRSILPIPDIWRYLLLLALFAGICYLLLRTNPNKGKMSIAQMSLIPLLSSAWLQVLYYSMLGYAARKEWYWVSQFVITALTFGILLGMLYAFIRRFRYRQTLAWVLAVCTGVSLGVLFWQQIRSTMPYHYWAADAPYMDIVPLLEKHTEPGSIIGLTGGGNAGYFVHERTVVNMDGLINSYPYFQALRTGQGGQYLYSIGLDYVLANPMILDQQPYKGQFDRYLEPLDIRYGGKQLMHYRAPK